jgi:hypothetical protein
MTGLPQDGNRVPAEYERRLLQALVNEERQTLDSLREQITRRKAECSQHERMVEVSENAADATRSLKECAESIENGVRSIQETYQEGLLANHCQEAVSIMPTTDKFLEDWQVAIEALVAVSSLLTMRIEDTEKRITEADGHQQTYQSLADHLQQSISCLSANCKGLSTSIEKKRLGLLHPLRLLPSEILSLIFEAAVDDEYYTLHGRLHDSTAAETHFPHVAFRIASVSRRWRGVALGRPRLWRYICVPVITSQTRHTFGAFKDFRKSIGKHQWDRSMALTRDLPIEVTILGEDENPGWNSLFNQTGRKWDRINIIALRRIPSYLPSPRYLYIVSKVAVEIPSSVLSSTKVIYCLEQLPTFAQPVTSLRTLSFSLPPRGPWPELALVLTNHFPALTALEFICPVQSSGELYSPRTTVRTHNSLRRLFVSSSLLSYIGSEMNGGIIIPSLTHFIVTGIDSSLQPSNFAWLGSSGTSLIVTVTNLKLASRVGRERAVAISTVSKFIQIFKVLSVIELEGTMTGTGVNALFSLHDLSALSKVVVRGGNLESGEFQEDLQRLRKRAPHLGITRVS